MSRAKNLAKDLLNLEINTILVDGISSTKVPETGEILEDIIRKYKNFLLRTKKGSHTTIQDAGLSHKLGIGPGELDLPGKLKKETFPGAFENLREYASKLINLRDEVREEGVRFSQEKTNVLHRVSKNCRSLSKLLENKNNLELSAAEVMKVRKIWEIGVERVLMQTVVQLDGDIITRIQIGRETEKDKILHEIHKDLVHLAVKNWQFMVQTLLDIAKSTFKSIFKA